MDFLIFFVTRLLWLMVFLVVGIYIIMALRIIAIHRYLIYNPKKEIDLTPGSIGLPYQDIYFETKDHVMLNAWFIEAKEPKAVVLHCHGNSGNISERIDNFIKVYYNMGLSLFIFDYRGYGKSQGKPSEYGTYKDVEAAWEYLVSDMQIDPKNIIITAHSLGGPIASYLATKVSPKALIIEGTFTNIVHMGKLFFPYFPIRFLVWQRYNTENHLKKINCPLMVIHSQDDKFVPFFMGKALYRAANHPKRFLQIKGTHNDAILISRERYVNEINQFIADIDLDLENEAKQGKILNLRN